jgi:hypothetical protein
LTEARSFFRDQTLEAHVRNVFQMAGLATVVMTNDPLDPAEAAIGTNGRGEDQQFQAVVRLDRLVREWPDPWPQPLCDEARYRTRRPSPVSFELRKLD